MKHRENIFSNSVITVIISLFFLTGLANASGSSAEPVPNAYRSFKTLQLNDGVKIEVEGLFNPVTDNPVLVQGGFSDVLLLNPTSEELLGLIDEYPDYFNISSEQLEMITCENISGKTIMNAVQVIDDRPVRGTSVVLRIDRNGHVSLWGSDIVKVDNPGWRAEIDIETAMESFAGNIANEAVEVVSNREIWFRSGRNTIPAYEMIIACTNPMDMYIVHVNTLNGEVLKVAPYMMDFTIDGWVNGPVYRRNPNAEAEVLPISEQFVNLVDVEAGITDSAGYFEFSDLDEGEYNLRMTLENSFFIMQNCGFEFRPNAEDLRQPYTHEMDVNTDEEVNFDWEQDSDEYSLAAVNAFHHLNFFRNWWRDMDEDLSILDELIHIFVDQDGMLGAENACYMPAMAEYNMPHGIYLGAGSDVMQNFALVADIIYHEYTHAITLILLDRENQGEIGAMHEGFSDYFAATIVNSSEMGTGIYIDEPERPHRNLDNDLQFPDDMEDEPHHDGMIIGGALWDMREALGAEITDPLAHYARYGNPRSFEAYLDEILFLDDDNGDLSDGTPNSHAILKAFSGHGIGEGDNGIADNGNEDYNLSPASPLIYAAYPNPFNSTTTFGYRLPNASRVKLDVFDMNGRLVGRIFDGYRPAGDHSAIFSATDLPSGVYSIRLNANGNVSNRMVNLLR